MDASVVSMIISLLGGLAGGNISGAAAPDKSLGTAGNSVAGLLGGGLGGYLLQALDLLGKSGVIPGTEHAATTPGLDIASILASVASGGVGGGVLTFIIGLIKNAINKA